jgi:putative spermidine/putrescine transport system substrate-binding protein
MRTNTLVFQLLGLLAASAFALTACGSAAPAAVPAAAEGLTPTQGPTASAVPPATQPAAATPGPAVSLDQLITAASQEGELSVIALPHDRCNYGGAISEFQSLYGIPVNELDPEASSAAELQAILDSKDNPGPDAPDVVDVGLSFAPQAAQQGLFQPYRVSTWNDIPADAKDGQAYWYAGYFGVMSFEVNTHVVRNVPQDWPDLLKPDYKNQVALSGDPRSAVQAADAVYAAGLSVAGGNIANAGRAGLDFFDKLNKEGNFVPTAGTIDTVAKGQTPISLTWDYLSLADAAALGGNPHIRTVVPKTGVLADVHVQAISAYAPHPNAARLWEEYLYSNAGQLQLLKGYCHPIRFSAMIKADKIPQQVLDRLPAAANYADAMFPSLDQQMAYMKQIRRDWDTIVGAEVK